MKLFLPDMYQKNILEINYEKLKKKKIKVLLFDFDNTILEKGKKEIDSKTKNLIKNLKKDFEVIILSNTLNSDKLKKSLDGLEVKYIKFALKPSKRGFKKVLKMFDNKNEEICMIGDQLITDVLGAKRNHIYSILVDVLGEDIYKFTKINRLIEKVIYKRSNKKYGFERHKYYD